MLTGQGLRLSEADGALKVLDTTPEAVGDLAAANGITLHSATTAAGGTKSATADIGAGLALVGAP